MVVGLPTLYILYVSCVVYRQDLLPRMQENRSLVIYFLRITVVFYVMWLPTLLFFFVLGPQTPFVVGIRYTYD